MENQASESSTGRITFLVMLLILAGVIAVVVIDGNSKRAMAPVLTSQQEPSVAFTDASIVSIMLGDVEIIAPVAATDAKRMQGLSGSQSLASHEGLLFVFPRSGMHGIWMKDMNYAIDIIWLDTDFSVVHIAADVAPETFPDVFTPTEPARFVLEVSAGTAQRAGLNVGDIVVLDDEVTSYDVLEHERDQRNTESNNEDIERTAIENDND